MLLTGRSHVRSALLWAAPLVAALLSSSWVKAEEAGPGSGSTEATSTTPTETAALAEGPAPFVHRGRFHLRLGMVGGIRMVFRYADDSAYCADPDEDLDQKQRFCGHQAPWALESAVGYGVNDSLEPFLFGRFGLSGERQTNTAPLRLLGIGTRLYTMSDSRLKVFFQPALALELEGSGDDPRYRQFSYETDFVVHLGAGLQVEILENLGGFLEAGMTTGIIRSLHSNLMFHLGVQGLTPSAL